MQIAIEMKLRSPQAFRGLAELSFLPAPAPVLLLAVSSFFADSGANGLRTNLGLVTDFSVLVATLDWPVWGGLGMPR